MVKDKDFQADAERVNIELSPIDGKGVLDLVKRAADTPKDVIALYNEMVPAGH